MTPTFAGYLHGLRRYWWILLLTAGAGLAFGLLRQAPTQVASAVTTSNILFTLRAEGAGTDSDGSARAAEAEVAQSRLQAYLTIARQDPAVLEILDAGLVEAQTPLLQAGGRWDSDSRVFVGVTGDPKVGSQTTGLVEVRLKNSDTSSSGRDFSQPEAEVLVSKLAGAVAKSVLATDSLQARPSLRSDPLVLDAREEVPVQPATSSPLRSVGLWVALGLVAGLGIVFLLVWRAGRITSRADIDNRIGARVLGEYRSGPADAAALALALCRGRQGSVTALLVPSGDSLPNEITAQLGAQMAAAADRVGLPARLVALGARESSLVPASGGAGVTADPGSEPVLTIIDAVSEGLTAEALHAATSVDLVAVVVQYGRTSAREILRAGNQLHEVTEAEITLIAVVD
jgi:hypothetical protein